MSKTKIEKIMTVVMILIICLFILPVVSNAANVSANVGTTTLDVGGTTTYTVKANNCAGRFSITSSDASVVAVEGTTSEYLDNTSLSVTLRAKKAGTATITVKYLAADYDTGIDDESSKSVKITVKDQAPENNGGGSSGSGDNNLKSITVAGKKYTNPSTDFTVNVDSGVTSTEVSAEASHGSAKISGTGRKELSTGTNTVTITVTAENGAKKTYNVRIRRLADTSNQTPNKSDNQNNNQPVEPEQNPEDQQQQEPELLRLTYLIIEDVELTPEFDSEVFEYTANVINKENLDIVKVVNKEDATVEITGDKELVDGENIVTIKLTKDAEEVEYKITVYKTTEELVTAEPENQEPEETEKGFWENYRWAIIAGGILLAVVIIVVVVIVRANATDEMSERARRRMEKKREKHRGFED